jgi:hypothetical protein
VTGFPSSGAGAVRSDKHTQILNRAPDIAVAAIEDVARKSS